MSTRGLRSRFPRAGSLSGEQKKLEFIAALGTILGDVRLLWMPDIAETTTSTDLSRHGATLTYDATFADKYSTLGSGTYATFDGTADEADCPDDDRYSFGDGAVDEPFSIVALVNPDDGTPAAANTILAKMDSTTGIELREWGASVSLTNGYPRLELHDESANAHIGREDQTALTSATWVLLAFTYDGSGANTGINIYKNGVVVDDADFFTGAYVAMENTATVVQLAHTESSGGAPAYFLDGGMALVALSHGALSVHEAETITQLVNGYFDLAL